MAEGRIRRVTPEEIAANGWRIVVVRLDGKGPRVALCTGSPAPGFQAVQLAAGNGSRYSRKSHRVMDVEVLRDASPREVSLGYVP